MKKNQKYTFLSFMLMTSFLVGCRHDKDLIIEIKDQDGLASILTKSSGPIVLTLHMEHCGWCEKMNPIIKNIACNRKFNNISFYRADGLKLSAAQGQSFKTTNQIIKETTDQDLVGYPFMLFINDGKYVDKQIGGTTEHLLAEKIADSFPDFVNKKAKNHNYCCAQ